MGAITEALGSFSEPQVRGNPEAARGRSAVLMVLYPGAEGVHVLLTTRSSNLRSHTSEVSFPGGREDPEDVDLWATALREAHEEVDLDPSLPRQIGRLDSFVTVGSGSLIHPFVAEVAELPPLTASPDEVAEILDVPLAELALDEVWREEIWTFRETTRAITFFELEGNTVWGATAAILRQFLTVVFNTTDQSMGERFG